MDKLLYSHVMEHNNKNEALIEHEWILKSITLGSQRIETVRYHSYKTAEWARLINSEIGGFPGAQGRVGGIGSKRTWQNFLGDESVLYNNCRLHRYVHICPYLCVGEHFNVCKLYLYKTDLKQNKKQKPTK